jgi:hypothetical protein
MQSRFGMELRDKGEQAGDHCAGEISLPQQCEIDCWIETVRSALDESAFAAAWLIKQALRLERAIELALPGGIERPAFAEQEPDVLLEMLLPQHQSPVDLCHGHRDRFRAAVYDRSCQPPSSASLYPTMG